MRGTDMSKIVDMNFIGVGVLFLAYFTFVSLIVGLLTWWTDSNIDYWLTHFKGVETNCPWYLSLLATVGSGGLCIPLNIISEIAALFV